MTTLPEHYRSNNSIRTVEKQFTADEIDIIRCAINRLLRAGPQAAQVAPEIWGPYRLKLEELREHIRIGPPDERSQGL